MKAQASSPNNVTRQATQSQKRRRLLRIFLGLREIACCFFIEFDLFYTHVSKTLEFRTLQVINSNSKAITSSLGSHEYAVQGRSRHIDL